MAAIARACAQGEIEAEVAIVIAPAEASPALEVAQELGLPIEVVEPGDSYGERLLAVLEAHSAQLVCLAGFMRLLPSEVLAAYPGRVLNIHPALLPKHGGKGMYGMRVHEAVLAGGDRLSGATVHQVTEQYDEGAIVLQATCPVLPDDTPETLAARVLEQEHRVYVAAIRKVIQG